MFTRAGAIVVQRPVLTVFLVALVVRLAVAATIALTVGAGFVPDAALNMRLARTAAAGEPLDELPMIATWLWEHNATVYLPLTLVYKAFGPGAHYGAQALVGIAGAGAAAAVTAVALRAWSVRTALAAGLMLALLPSQVFYSSVVIKDPLSWALLAGLGLLVALGMRRYGPQLLWWGAGVSALLFLLAHTRRHTFVVACIALVLAALLAPGRGRVQRLAGATAIALVLPWALGLGPGGYDYVVSQGNPEVRRALLAEERVHIVEAPAPDPEEPGRAPRTAVLDDRVVAADRPDPGREALHLPAGLAMMLLAPYPWERGGSTQLRLARLEMIVWYPVLLLALLGVPAALPRRTALAFPVVLGGGLLLMYALVQGNVGTATRHRGEFVWVVVLLAAAGLSRLTGWDRDATRGELSR